MPTMGVCDSCGMLVRLTPDGRCPRGHPGSRIHDRFETLGSSSASSGLFGPDLSEFAEPRDAAPPQGAGGTQPPPQETPQSRPTQQAPGAAQQARVVRRVGLIVVGIVVAIQVITACGGILGAILMGD